MGWALKTVRQWSRRRPLFPLTIHIHREEGAFWRWVDTQGPTYHKATTGRRRLSDRDLLGRLRPKSPPCYVIPREQSHWLPDDPDEATKSRLTGDVQLGTYRFIHLATHGFLNERRPEFSGLLFAGRLGDAGPILLEAREIGQLRLGAELVVLSACETALGKRVAGEEILGLSQAFFRAGAGSVVASLWRVDGASTADLMTGFYTALTRTTVGRAEALREAKLRLLGSNRFGAPYHWAPFVLFSD